MSRQPQIEIAKLTVRLTGHDYFWSVIKVLDSRGPWTVGDVDSHSSTRNIGTVSDFVRRLHRGGYAELVGERPGRQTPQRVYQLLRSPVDTPSLRRDGSACPMPAQQRIWNAIRGLKKFTIPELHYVASQDAPIALNSVRRYVSHLAAAEYFAVTEDHPRPASYFLRPAMETGPRAPKILRAHVVWDDNKQAVIGARSIDAHEVAA